MLLLSSLSKRLSSNILSTFSKIPNSRLVRLLLELTLLLVLSLDDVSDSIFRLFLLVVVVVMKVAGRTWVIKDTRSWLRLVVSATVVVLVVFGCLVMTLFVVRVVHTSCWCWGLNDVRSSSWFLMPVFLLLLLLLVLLQEVRSSFMVGVLHIVDEGCL